MNRNLFIIILAVLLISGTLFLEYGLKNIFLIYLLLASIACFFRRHYLGFHPWWGGKLKEIPKYFQKP